MKAYPNRPTRATTDPVRHQTAALQLQAVIALLDRAISALELAQQAAPEALHETHVKPPREALKALQLDAARLQANHLEEMTEGIRQANLKRIAELTRD